MVNNDKFNKICLTIFSKTVANCYNKNINKHIEEYLMIVGSIIETVAYGLVIIGLLFISAYHMHKVPHVGKGKGNLKRSSVGFLGVLSISAAFILLIIATWT